MSVTLQQVDGPAHSAPLTWYRANGFVIATCPSGHESALIRPGGGTPHIVGPGGLVTPSLICLTTGCLFHEWIVLADYAKESQPHE